MGIILIVQSASFLHFGLHLFYTTCYKNIINNGKIDGKNLVEGFTLIFKFTSAQLHCKLFKKLITGLLQYLSRKYFCFI
jgi:hypothetical protein